MNTLTWLRGGTLVALYAVLLTPFIVANDLFFPFITGKAFYFRIMVEVAFVGYVMLAVLNPAKYAPKKSWVLFALSGFVAIVFIADIFGVFPAKSLWSNFERMEGWVTLVHILMYVTALVGVLQSDKDWKRYIAGAALAAVCVSFVGVFQILGLAEIHQGSTRVTATLGNAAYLAGYLLFHIGFTAFLFSHTKSSPARWLLGAVFILLSTVLFFTATRGAILGLIAGIFASGLWYVFFDASGKGKKIALGLIAGVIVLVGGFIAVRESNFVQSNETLQRMASITLSEGNTRFTIWGIAFEGIKERPLLGWGQENFNRVFNKYYDPSLYAQEQWFDRVHNTPLDWLIATGIIGFLAYLFLGLVAIRALWKKTSGLPRAILFGILVAYAVHSFFVFDNLLSYLPLAIVLGYLIFREGVSFSYFEKMSPRTELIPLVIPVGFVVLVLSFFALHSAPYTSVYHLVRGVSPVPGGLQGNLEHFDRALNASSLGDQEVREHLAQFSMSVASQGTIPPQVRESVTRIARDEMANFLLRIDGEDARLQLLYGLILRARGESEAGLQALERAVALSPKKQTLIIQLGIMHLELGQKEDAYNYFRYAYELDTRFDQSALALLSGAIAVGDTALIQEISEKHFGGSIPDEPLILLGYQVAGNLEAIVASWERRLEESPQDVDILIRLGASYHALGKRTLAREALLSALQLAPERKEEIEAYLKEVGE